MGGKRPDQYNIDPREGGATDYKTLPENGHGGSMEGSVNQDRREMAQSEHDERGIPAPAAHPAPSKYVAAAQERQQEGQGGDDSARQREARGNTEPGKDEVGA